MRVMPFQETDLPEILILARRMHLESEYRKLAFDPEFIRKLLENALNQDAYGPFVAFNEAGRAVGFILGHVSQTFFGPDLVASELAFYVSPEARGSSAAIRLMQAYDSWACMQGAKEIFLGITTGINELKTTELFNRSGFHHAGRLFKKGGV